MNRLALAVVGAAIFLVPGAANAVTLSLAGAPSYYSDYALNSAGRFDLDNIGAAYTSLSGGYGVDNAAVKVLYANRKSATTGLAVSDPAKLTFTYLGKEAGFNNSLKFPKEGTTIFQSNASAVGDKSGSFNILAGLISFIFTSNSSAHFVSNDGSASAGMNIAYLLLSATSALVFLDDYGGGPDHDFDDIGVRIDVAAVPLPGGLLLLGGGLGLLGVFGWRKKRATGAAT